MSVVVVMYGTTERVIAGVRESVDRVHIKGSSYYYSKRRPIVVSESWFFSDTRLQMERLPHCRSWRFDRVRGPLQSLKYLLILVLNLCQVEAVNHQFRLLLYYRCHTT